jgi:hypothetical protein
MSVKPTGASRSAGSVRISRRLAAVHDPNPEVVQTIKRPFHFERYR